MGTYILVSFWIMFVVGILKVFVLAFSEYPRKMEYSLGLDVASLIEKIPFLLWAAYLLWA